ncbi:MAG TPA: kelch repeat-containing protein [Solirubrobacter sp.]
MHRRAVIASIAAAVLLAGATRADAATDATPGWASSPKMAEPRFDHFAVTLADGRVLVGGGNSGSAVLATAQIYNPRYDGWDTAAPMFVARQRATATLLADGRVFVMGGLSTSAPSSAQSWGEMYDPVKNAWHGTDKAAFGRVGHAAVLLTGGSVLVVGGDATDGTPTKLAQLYDPVTDKWLTVPDMNTARTGMTATRLKDGRVLVVGGTGAGNAGLASAEIFTPSTQQWTTVAPMTTPRRSGHTATLLTDGRVLVAGGYDTPSTATAGAEIYTPATNTWAGVTNGMQYARAGHTATRMTNGDVLIANGEYPAPSWTESETYTPATNAFGWYYGLAFESRTGARSALMGDGRVLVTGGTGTLPPEQDTLRYTPTTSYSITAGVWDLGAQPVGSVGPLRQLSVKNTGDQPLLFSNLAVKGVSSSEFKVDAGGCGVAVVAPGESCQLGLRFAPTAEGQRRANFTFKVNSSGGPPPSVDVKGLGTATGMAPTPTPTSTPPATPEATPEPQPSSRPDLVASVTPTPVPTPKAAAKDARIVFRNGYRVAAKLRASSCRGKVSLELRRGKAVLAKRTTRLDGQCRFGATFTIGWGRIGNVKTLTVVAHFHGNRHFGATTNRFVVAVPKRS